MLTVSEISSKENDKLKKTIEDLHSKVAELQEHNKTLKVPSL
jgi:coenzyme F420-reducing hydrogenase delta subunit